MDGAPGRWLCFGSMVFASSGKTAKGRRDLDCSSHAPLFSGTEVMVPFLQRENRRGGYATCHLKKKLVNVRVYKSSHITWSQVLKWVFSCLVLGLDVCPSVLPKVFCFFSSLGRDLSLVTTQLGDLSLRLHICPREERREFVDGRGFTASVGTDSFPGLREHRGVPGNSLDEVLVRPG